ncbi:MAG: hypothetical protein R3D71_01135 [Rickettsiales bacterium]
MDFGDIFDIFGSGGGNWEFPHGMSSASIDGAEGIFSRMFSGNSSAFEELAAILRKAGSGTASEMLDNYLWYQFGKDTAGGHGGKS